MKTICAWCKKVLEEGPERPVTHGACRICELKCYEEGKMLTEDERKELEGLRKQS